MLLAGTIFILTLVLVIWQPRGLGIGWSAAFGAALAQATGGVQVADIRWYGISSGMRPPPLSPLSLSACCLMSLAFSNGPRCDVSRWGRGRGRLLFTWIILLGAAVAALFANDGAALILTPIRDCHAASAGVQQGNDAGLCHGRRIYWPIPPACRWWCRIW